ncbi:hypothetical protein Goshw_001639 [Gossypium schwendimanii]|uniref:TF-B3 domain-containing protein n=1 Tax=Gossypium schwendimanii TaxID=34291 RepID=A0A7J9MNC9_GOSSC|nr:hypothetical protein [Gossypium schwendimanii]
MCSVLSLQIAHHGRKLTYTDINKRLAIPKKILPSLPRFNRSHAVKIQLMSGTKIWSIDCTVRKQGYKKPVFSGGWRKFVVHNELKIGDRVTIYRVQHQDGSSHYRVEVEKPAAGNHEADETTVTRHRREQLPNAPMINMLANVAVNTLVDDHVIAKPLAKFFGTNITDEACCKIIADQRHSLDLVLRQSTIC